MAKEHGTYDQIAYPYIGLAISYLVHQWSFFYIAKYSGCVLAGINKAIQTVSVFVVSTVFCSVQPTQCFSFSKAVALCLVVIGVLMYSHASSFVEHEHGPSLHQKEIELSQNMPLSGSALDKWTCDDVERWICSSGEGFQRLGAALKSLGIDGSDLATVDEHALKDLGFESQVIRKKFLKLLSRLISEHSVASFDDLDDTLDLTLGAVEQSL